MINLWYKNAIVYCLDVDTYMDGNGDGIGDFAGLASRLDYLAGIGVTCLWLLPFFPSPNRDNGYDITDFYNVAPQLGTLGDFVDFAHQAHERGIRIIADLVVNHTSDQHPWFKEACKNPDSRFRDFYVWSKTKPKDADQGMVFPGVQETTWTYNRQARAYYFHRFYEHQPDLNIANLEVREEIQKIMGFWLQLGVSGFRMDAVPFVIEQQGVEDPLVKDPLAYLTEMRDFLSWRRADAIILAEANVEPAGTLGYFGDNNRLHMMFNFWLNQHLFLALATRNAEPIYRAFKDLPQLPSFGQWANFLRNHDEIDLGRLSDDERQAVYADMGPDESMQLYGRGIRRRLAPMLGGDQRRLELAFSLLYSLPGTPVVWYGDEIGMGDDLALPERSPVRTPMQWSAEANGGFSAASPMRFPRPVVSGGGYGYEHLNVQAQRRDHESLLNAVERLIRTRKECPEFGRGEWHLVKTSDPSVLAHCCQWRDGTVMAVHNLSSEPRAVRFDLNPFEAEHLIDLMDDTEAEIREDGSYELRLPSYGYFWYRLSGTRR